MLTGGVGGTVILWHADTGRELRRFFGHEGLVASVAYCPDGRRVVTGGGDQTVRLWDAASGQELHRFGELGGVKCVTVAPDGRRVVVGGQDGRLRLLDLPAKEVPAVPGKPAPPPTKPDVRAAVAPVHPTGMAFSLDGRRVATGGPDNLVRLWDLETGEELRRFEGHKEPVPHLALSPDGRRLLSAAGKAVHLWETTT